MAFALSATEPPPTPKTASILCFFESSIPSLTLLRSGLLTTPESSTNSILLLLREFIILSYSPLALMLLVPYKKRTFLIPASAK